MKARYRIPTVLVVAVFVLAGCGSGAEPGGSGSPTGEVQTGRPLVLVSTSILASVVSDTLRGTADVEVLIPDGADLHAAAPSAKQRKEMGEADLIVIVGLGLESGFDSAIDGARDDGVTVLEIGPQLDPLKTSDEGHGDEGHDDEGHDHGPSDPHVWLDPSRMSAVPHLVVEALLEERANLDEAELRAKASVVEERIHDLDAELEDLVSSLPRERRLLVTDHAVFGYFADRYDFEIVGSIVDSLSTSAEPTASDLAALVDAVNQHGVQAVFTDVSGTNQLAEALASEADSDVRVVPVRTESLGNRTDESSNYEGFMRDLMEAVVGSLAE